ncbi:MAG: hypothetical protein RL150_390 [Candidatus Parcubacteria bacterium]|jgi:hypothetical protein
MWQAIKQAAKKVFVCMLILFLFLSGFPSKDFFAFARDAFRDRNVIDSLYLALQDKDVVDRDAQLLLNSPVPKASAATFQMNSGYYIGNGGVKTISGLGFRPELILLKSNSATIASVFHTNIMPDDTTAYMGSATADSTAGFVRIEEDGFEVYSTANTANTRYTWVAFAGSDCSASGTMCIGSYVGNGASNQAITSVGFQPDLVWTKRTTNERSATWRSSSMSTNYGQYFSATTQDTTGVLFQTLDATGFTVGLSNNTSTGIYYYVAFKEVSGFMDVGTYTGNATDNRSITGVGFKPDWVFLKNANAGTPVAASFSQKEMYGDSTGLFTAAQNISDSIQTLESDGFQVGANSSSNGTTNTVHYAAFKGVPAVSSSGTFKMASGSYTADSTIKIIEGLDFKPDLVIIKGETTQAGVFRTSLMGGNSTAYLDSATANFSGGITAMNHDGFTIGEHATVNTHGITYHWQAFGGAWNPETKSGSSDFYIGAYYGNTLDNRTVADLPFQADLLVVKRFGASGGVFKTSAHTGDTTSSFAATADVADYIQTINADGFQVGNGGSSINANGQIYFYFGFKEGSDFDVGTYSGNASDNRDITNPGFDPDLAWIKRSTAVAGVTRPSTLAGDLTQYFITTAQAAGRIKSFVTGGFRLGTQTEVNASGGTYYYATWDVNSTQSAVDPVDYAMRTGYYMGNGTHQEITGLGFRPEMVIIKANTNAGHGTVYKNEYMPESAVNGLGLNSSSAVLTETATYDIIFQADGFRVVGANTNTVNAGYTWIAFAGSNCTITGAFCTGGYLGTYGVTNGVPVFGRKLKTGFPPGLLAISTKSAGIGPIFTTQDFQTDIGTHGAFAADFGAASAATELMKTNDLGIGILNGNYSISAIGHYFFGFAGKSGTYDTATYEWTRTAGPTAGNALSGNSITVDSVDGDVFVGGNFTGTVDLDPTSGTDSRTATAGDIYLSKYTASGSYGWSRVFGGSGSDAASSVAADSSGNIFVSGNFSNSVDFDDTGGTDTKASVGSSDVFVTKYNADGSYGWTRNFGNSSETEKAITTDPSGNVFIVGSFGATIDFDGTAGTDSKGVSGNIDAFLTKYNADGSYGWTRAVGGTAADSANSVATDSSGNVFITGSFTGTVDLDGTAGTDSRTSNTSSTDVFITKYNADGTYGWSRVFGGTTSNDQGIGISVDGDGNVYTTGEFEGTVDFDDNGGTDNVTPFNSKDVFVTKYNADGSYGWTKRMGTNGNDLAAGIAVDTDGNSFTLGHYASGRALIQLSSSGIFKTTNTIPDVRSTGANAFTGHKVAINGADVHVVGNFKNTVNFDDTGGTDTHVGTPIDTENLFTMKYSFGTYNYTTTHNDVIESDSYAGDGTSRTITTGFSPDFVWVRGNNGSAYSIFNTKNSFGSNTSFINDLANLVGGITGLGTNSFQVANNINANQSAINYYYTALKETATPATPSGSFTMETGTYTGNGAYKRIGGLSGKPDLLIIKGETTQQSVFRTKVMPSNSTAYLGSATANLGLAISSLNHDGFNVGNSATVNSAGVTYHYQAFYGAYDELNGGSADFTLGHYYGNGVNDRDIKLLPFQPDIVTVKRSGATAGGFRTSAHTGDLTSSFAATADTADMIQAFNTDGFEIGTNAMVNTAANYYWWFAFKEGIKFDVGTYTGNGSDNRDITDSGFTPDLVWVKRSTAVAGVMRPSTLAGDLTQWFINTAQAADRIQALISTGFTLGTQTEVNANSGLYYFASWSESGVPQPTFTQAAYRFFGNTDSTDVGSALDTQDTPSTLSGTGDSFRLRLLLAINDANLALSGETFKLQFVEKGAGTCASPSGGTPASYTDVTDSTVIAYNDNTTPADAAALTANANDPTDAGRTIVNQSYQELNDFTNDEAAINNGQDGKWDFALVDNGADADTTFCFRVVTSDGTPLDTYTEYPEITTAAGTQSLTFAISDNSVGFGTLTTANARYATGDGLGSTSDTTAPTVISVSSASTGGYSLTVSGSTLTCAACGGATIAAIGGTPAASAPGTNQFGIRVATLFSEGTGSVTAPYSTSNWVLDTANFPDEIGSGPGDGSETPFGVRYIANTAALSNAGEYNATLTYTVTATY